MENVNDNLAALYRSRGVVAGVYDAEAAAADSLPPIPDTKTQLMEASEEKEINAMRLFRSPLFCACLGGRSRGLVTAPLTNRFNRRFA